MTPRKGMPEQRDIGTSAGEGRRLQRQWIYYYKE